MSDKEHYSFFIPSQEIKLEFYKQNKKPYCDIIIDNSKQGYFYCGKSEKNTKRMNGEQLREKTINYLSSKGLITPERNGDKLAKVLMKFTNTIQDVLKKL